VPRFAQLEIAVRQFAAWVKETRAIVVTDRCRIAIKRYCVTAEITVSRRTDFLTKSNHRAWPPLCGSAQRAV
jgi:hypothetical protein